MMKPSMRGMRMRLLLSAVVVALFCLPGLGWPDESGGRVIHGEVVAVTLNETPNILVLKATGGSGKEMIIGATVETDATVTRGKQRIALSEVKVGERVELKYIKNPDGLIAKSIHVR